VIVCVVKTVALARVAGSMPASVSHARSGAYCACSVVNVAASIGGVVFGRDARSRRSARRSFGCATASPFAPPSERKTIAA
jgi:hypothetical protein